MSLIEWVVVSYNDLSCLSYRRSSMYTVEYGLYEDCSFDGIQAIQSDMR